jgi:hypothetical protein
VWGTSRSGTKRKGSMKRTNTMAYKSIQESLILGNLTTNHITWFVVCHSQGDQLSVFAYFDKTHSSTSVCIFIAHFLIGNVLLVDQRPFTTLKLQNLFKVWLWDQNLQGSFNPYELLNTFPLNATMQHYINSLI